MGGGSEQQTVSPVSDNLHPNGNGTENTLKKQRKISQSESDSTNRATTFRRRTASSAGEKLHHRRKKKHCVAPVVHVSEAHEYMKTWNPHITEGYRLCASYGEVFKSLFYFHNCWWDTITALFNIVHSLLLSNYTKHYPLDDEDTFVFGCFFLTAWIHSLPSAAYHLIGCSGKSYFEYVFYQRLNFLFIFISSIPLSVALGYYRFYTQPLWFWVTVLGVVAMAAYTTSVIRTEMSPDRRLKLIGGLVFFYFIPIFSCILSTLYGYLISGVVSSLAYAVVPSFYWSIGAIAALTMGAFTYAARFPECLIPNFPFSSHSWMHLGVNLAYLSEFFFIVHQLSIVKS